MEDRRRPRASRSTAAVHGSMAHQSDSGMDDHALALPVDVVVHVPAETASVPLVRRLVHAALEEAGVETDLVDDVTLATDEACTNLVLHGTRTQRAAVSYDVAVHIAPDRCVVSVAEQEDATPAGERSAAPVSLGQHAMANTAAEHGRGIALMALLMDGVQLEKSAAGSFRLLLEKGLHQSAPRVHPLRRVGSVKAREPAAVRGEPDAATPPSGSAGAPRQAPRRAR